MSSASDQRIEQEEPSGSEWRKECLELHVVGQDNVDDDRDAGGVVNFVQSVVGEEDNTSTTNVIL